MHIRSSTASEQRFSPPFLRKEMGHPQHHAEPKVLGDDEIGRRLVDDFFHLGDLVSQRLFVEEPI